MIDKQDSKLRELVREHLDAALDELLTEMTSTGNVAGYLTPNAFTGDEHSASHRINKMAKAIGYTITARGKEDIKPGDTLVEASFPEYRDDKTKLPHQKIGLAISEINKQLKLVERILQMSSRLKTENGISNDVLWKRTNTQMLKLENKLLQLSTKLRSLRN